MTFRVVLVVTSETLVVEHSAGDAAWILDALRMWVLQADPERGEELWLSEVPIAS